MASRATERPFWSVRPDAIRTNTVTGHVVTPTGLRVITRVRRQRPGIGAQRRGIATIGHTLLDAVPGHRSDPGKLVNVKFIQLPYGARLLPHPIETAPFDPTPPGPLNRGRPGSPELGNLFPIRTA